jgi:Arc/MetJ-type ribon-helix-helix transcriptional regulator
LAAIITHSTLRNLPSVGGRSYFEFRAFFATIDYRLKKSSPKPRRRQTRAEQIEEANKIFGWLAISRVFAADLIKKTAKRVMDGEESVIVLRDLTYITLALNSYGQSGLAPKWKAHQHHFLNARNRKAFFARLRRVTRRIASSRLNGSRPWTRERKSYGAIAWDASLLPPEAERHVVRVAILHPGILEYFLPRFFAEVPVSFAKKTTLNRAIQIVLAVPRLGWSTEKHTKNLIELKIVKPSAFGSESEMVKKAIRDLRSRHRKIQRALEEDPQSAAAVRAFFDRTSLRKVP